MTAIHTRHNARAVRASRLVMCLLLSLAVAVVVWAGYRQRCQGRAPLKDGNCPDVGDEEDPCSLKQGSIPGNRDGTPGTQVR